MDNFQVGGFNNLSQLDPETRKKIENEYNKINIDN